MKTIVAVLLATLSLFLSVAELQAQSTLAFEQPPDPSGGVILSSWYFPDGTDSDSYAYDSFVTVVTGPITEVRWRGGYQYTGYGLVNDFSITFYATNSTGSQPLCGLPEDNDVYLARYMVGSNAGETPVGSFGGIAMYDYHYELPQPFQVEAGVKYWVRIEGFTAGLPFWGLSRATGGDGSHFEYNNHMFRFFPHDEAFSLYTTAAPTYTITTSADPVAGGTTGGDGAYPPGSTATVTATPNTGWGFVNWTENGVPVSNSPNYTFTVSSDRDLVAHFMTAWTIATNAQPSIGGTTAGDGLYNDGSTVTVVATPNQSWEFVNWTEFGNPVSSSPSYQFVASANRTLTANFALPAGTVLFDFDDAPLHTPLPIDVTAGGITAHVDGTAGSYSVQSADVLGFTPTGFGGYCLYPSTLFLADLVIDFSELLSGFSIMYCPMEFGCDDSATMRVTAYRGATWVGTETTTVPTPGTYPVGVLSCSFPDGFDSVVVHYDSPPPICQDWVRVFLADNMIVTQAAPSAVEEGASMARVGASAYPNPFGDGTTIRFGLRAASSLKAGGTTSTLGARSEASGPDGEVSVRIYDPAGRLIRTLTPRAGTSSSIGEAWWDGRDAFGSPAPTGIYYCRILTAESEQSMQIVKLR